ncbi:hypothetical protein M409DRAFT_26265 [Zasmidium cellare ATCC 36951]|uniref:Nudix hydrolase domain-containing protein n=1 Tax=Zasmidium cellare ATCC 36951 TaxID=1080233 RepID=A0A6A6CC20_ZASCE|nr:uncharacterized protein M409DRAFT_26265 [Zasmidium cellare ATCC 36951]KAF2163219.1 hypothetical protein M409DRAFT_26265 [Zasmidium cellare ATCC 36951]
MTGGDEETSFLEVVKACDDFPYGPAAESYYQLYLPEDDQPHGYMLPEIVHKMPWTQHFSISHEHPRKIRIFDRSKGKDTATAINAAFQEVVDICIERDLFHVICARHSEPFAIAGARYGSPVYVERFAASLFGITTRGAHLVAYSKTPEGEMKLWIQRRSAHLYTYPNMLDSAVAGGVKSGVSPFETIVQEADEEASLSKDFVRQHAKSKGVLSHMGLTGKGFPGEQGLVTPDYIYVFDIQLPPDVKPKPYDDEVDCFYCMSIDEIKKALFAGDFKPDSGAVIVDFLIRNSVITPENEKNFVEINMRLHRWLPFRTG